ncbi:MAG: hypothetical protein ACLRJC_01780 [Emergencia timonensis]|uniref:hypothetical protein n=1 Tax=Emergencia timonensis TaxID=1776384 RepID=UPI0008299904|nr:hypothetical protein [Emergencia timonensis]WNX88841.1 hypothetical protein RVY71_00920 [Emergencia timonensis]
MKKLVVTLCLLTVLLSFAGCGENSSKQDGTGAAEKAKDLTMITQGRLRCTSDQGYYYIGEDSIALKENTFGFRMMYVDYETQKEIFLCNRPGCEHDSEECPAVFNDTDLKMGSSLLFYNGYLYLFSHDQDLGGGSMTDHSAGSNPMEDDGASFTADSACLYRMNPDGTDRKKVFTFDEGLSLEDQVFASRDTLYFITKKVTSEKVNNQTTYYASSQRRLVAVNTQDWKSSTICELDTDVNVIGAFDNQLVFYQTIFDHKMSREEMLDDNQYLDALNKSYNSYCVLDLAGGKSEEVAKLSNKKIHTYAVKGKKLYLSTEGKGKIEEIDLVSKEKKTFAETADSCIDRAYDDVLSCSSWGKNGEISDNSRLYIHLNDGSIDKSKMQMKSMEGAIEILGERKDQFLVLYDYDAKKDPVYEGQYNINGAKYALINKEDLYKGNENYHTIKLISSGLGL